MRTRRTLWTWAAPLVLLANLYCGPATQHVDAAQGSTLTKAQRAAITRTGRAVLLRPSDVGLPFVYNPYFGAPEVTITSTMRWGAFTALTDKTNVDTGLQDMYVFIDHYASASEAQAQIPLLVANGKVDGVDTANPFIPTPHIKGVTYLRFIGAIVDAWHADYAVVFQQGRYTTTLMFLVEMNGPHDTVFGAAGLNRYISLVLARERAHP